MGEAQAANNLADAYEQLGQMDEVIDCAAAGPGAEP